MAEGDVLVRQLRDEMESSRQATQALVQEMQVRTESRERLIYRFSCNTSHRKIFHPLPLHQSKLTWYAENQELLNKNDALVAEQRDTIQQLQARLVQYEGGC